jgi:uncharacterized protein YbjT (DUF2867 family)
MTDAMAARSVFITGATGYIGQQLIPLLLRRGHSIRALTRNGSESRLPSGAIPILGDVLDQSTFIHQIAPADTFIQLVGVAHPSPSKAEQFRSIDLVSVRASVAAAVETGAKHFIYVSAAQPSPMMKAYIAVRAEAESLIRSAKLNATILHPWYVLGPGHRWPYALLPIYWLLERLPNTRESASRLGLVTLEQMLTALVHAVENPASGVRIVEVPEIWKIS